MEIEVRPEIPTYSGGLGVLAGDTLRAAADAGLPMVAITLVHRRGYFHQKLDQEGNQTEVEDRWSPERRLEPLEAVAEVEVEGRTVAVRAWRHRIEGIGGHEIPVLFLDTDVPENDPGDRRLTDHLYGGDDRYRLCQEVVLGMGGIRMLRALGHESVRVHHMNEGHSALLTLALLEERVGLDHLAEASEADCEAVRRSCVFTTHTPVPAGHDQFPLDLAASVLGRKRADALVALRCCVDHTLNMTHVGLHFSRWVNGVAVRHGEIARSAFPRYPISSITNGVHVRTWTSPPFAELFDRYVPEWQTEPLNLRYAIKIPVPEVRQAHEAARAELFDRIEERTGKRLPADVFTLGFARRAATYKRADLLFFDIARLKFIAQNVGPLQVVYAGKAHPRDEGGKDLIRRVFRIAEELRGEIEVLYLPEYDTELARSLCAGVDVWLNTPQKPQEASGTSGMKAAVNGVPSLSVLDGWWVEGCVEGVTGWSIGEGSEPEVDPAREAESLYAKLEKEILPTFYGRPQAFGEIMRSAIALNGSFFNARRMVLQYAHRAYGWS